MKERLQKILSRAGISSRREAEKLILEGRIRVNGETVTRLGSKADPEKDHIKVNGKLIRIQRPVFLMLNKPKKFICSRKDPAGRRTVFELLKGVRTDVFSVGRLDYNSEGLLLFTNDGEMANRLMHPSGKVQKRYLVKIKGALTESDFIRIREGIPLPGGKTLPAEGRLIRKGANAWIELSLWEGRKNQIRIMLDHLGHPVLKLKRTGYGFLNLTGLAIGKYRVLTGPEIEKLKRATRPIHQTGSQNSPNA